MCFGPSTRLCGLIDRVRLAKSETLQQRTADPAFSSQDLVEVRAVDAVALGESYLRAGTLDRSPEQLTHFFVVDARRSP